jgi:hypothetical protein
MAKKSTASDPPDFDLADMVGKHIRALALGKKNYKRADALLAVIVREMEPGVLVTLANGETWELEDKFAGGKISVPVGQSARRYGFKQVTKI